MNLMRCLGLSYAKEQTQKPPRGQPIKAYALGNFDVEQHKTVSMATCCCGRSEPLLLLNKDISKAHPVCGHMACEVCLDEIDSCKYSRDQVAAWVRQNRARIRPDECLKLPINFSRLFAGKTSQRPRRFVYEIFHETQLGPKDKVLSTCGDPDCVNPYHAHCAKSCRTKLSPEIKQDLNQWLAQKIEYKTILDLMQEKHRISLSLRTLSTYKKSISQLLST